MVVDCMTADSERAGLDHWTVSMMPVLIDTLITKGVDVSSIYDDVDISFKYKVKLSEDKTRIILA